MRRTVTIELCIPPEEAWRRLEKARSAAFWSEEQRRELHLWGDLQINLERRTCWLGHTSGVFGPLQSQGAWSFSGEIDPTEKGSRMTGQIVLDCPLGCGSTIGLLAGAIALPGAVWFVNPPLSAALVIVSAVMVGLGIQVLEAQSIRRVVRHFEALFNVIFQGAIMSLTVSKDYAERV